MKMDDKTKIKIKRSGSIVELSFSHAQDILKADSKNFSIVDKERFEFKNGEIVVLPTKKIDKSK